MFLTVRGPAGFEENRTVDSQGLSMGQIFGAHADKIDLLMINGRIMQEWRSYVPVKGDRVLINGRIGAQALGIIIGLLVQVAMSVIMRALTPQPKTPKQGKRSEAFGLAGFNNTTGQGIPIPVWYGRNRVHGHVIASGADITEDGKSMIGRVLYCIGDSGGDGYESISEVTIDEVDIAQYEGTAFHVRLGTNDQTVIPEFENVDQLWHPNQQLFFDEETETGTPFVYTTQSNTVERSTLMLNFPNGLWTIDSDGDLKKDFLQLKVEHKLNSAGVGSYVEVPGSPFEYVSKKQSAFFPKIVIDHGSANKWDIRLTIIDQHQGRDEKAHGNTLYLYNVQETQFTTRTYAGYALLAITGINAKQFKGGLEALKVSALVEGKKVKVYQAGGGHVLQYTRKRCWIVRDMMTHPIVGMGAEIEDSEIEDDQWDDSQAYYDATVTGHDGTETRDLCDFGLTESRWDWEWVRSVCGEGRGRIIPSGDKWRYVLDAPGSPNLLFASPGNIIENSMVYEFAPPDTPFNQVIGEFRDETNDYKVETSPPISDPDIGVSILQKAIRYETLTRQSEVDRENMVVLKRSLLERRRWNFTSPIGAIVSEPMDLDWIADRSIGGSGPYSGVLPPGSTTTTVLLPEPVTLEADTTYAVIILHKSDNTTEYRTITTAAGTWLEVTIDSTPPEAPFVQAPAEFDVYAIGEEDVEHFVTRAQDLTIDNDGRVRQIRTEYIPAVYTPDALPSRPNRRRFPFQFAPPMPLRDAHVEELVLLNRDGSYRSVISFDVTPELHNYAGTSGESASINIFLASTEPAVDDFFVGAFITAAGQTRKIVAYIGATRLATIDTPWTTTPPDYAPYVIDRQRYGDFAGFVIEKGELLTDMGGQIVFEEDEILVWGTHYELDGGSQRGEIYYRFTPFSSEQIRNTTGRLIRSIDLYGDLSAPAAPLSVANSSAFKDVTVEVTIARPVAEDFAGVEIQIFRGDLNGPTLYLQRVGAPQDNAISGTMLIKHTITLPNESYGTSVAARARSLDFSNNKSAFINVPTVTVLQPVGTVDVAANAITATTEMEDAGPINHAPGGTLGHTQLGENVVITSTGGVIKIDGSCNTESEEAVVANFRVVIVRGTSFGVDPQVGESIITLNDLNHRGTNVVLASESLGAGTYTYSMWIETDGVDATVHLVRLSVFEVKR